MAMRSGLALVALAADLWAGPVEEVAQIAATLGKVFEEGTQSCEPSAPNVMTVNPATMEPGYTAIQALRLMLAPRTDSECDRLIAIVARGDFRRLEQARLDEAADPGNADAVNP